MMLLVSNFGKDSTRLHPDSFRARLHDVPGSSPPRPGLAVNSPKLAPSARSTPMTARMGAMSSFWLESKTPVAPPTSASPTLRQLVYAGVVTGSWSGVLSLVLYGIGRIAGTDFALVWWGGSTAEPMPWLVFLLLPLVSAVLFALAASLARGLAHARSLVYWIGTLLALASLIPAIDQPSSVGWATRILLIVMHLLTWFLVVPQIARILGDSEPGQHEERHA